MRKRIALPVIIVLLIPILFLKAQTPSANPRFALVIGNSNYTGMPAQTQEPIQ